MGFVVFVVWRIEREKKKKEMRSRKNTATGNAKASRSRLSHPAFHPSSLFPSPVSFLDCHTDQTARTDSNFLTISSKPKSKKDSLQ